LKVQNEVEEWKSQEEELENSYALLKKLYKERQELKEALPQIKSNQSDLARKVESKNQEMYAKANALIEEIVSKIEDKKEQLLEYQPYMVIELSDYEEYLSIKNKSKLLKKQIHELDHLVADGLGSYNELEKESSKRYHYLMQSEYVEEFLHELRQYKKLENSLLELNTEIEQRKKKRQQLEENTISRSKLSQMEVDYQKILELKEREKEEVDDSGDSSDDKLKKAKSKRTVQSLFTLLFASIGVILLIFSMTTEDRLLYILTIDIGISSLFCALYFGYLVYKRQISIGKLEYIKRYQKINNNIISKRYDKDKTQEELFEKYKVSSLEELETLFLKYKENEFAIEVLKHDEQILKTRTEANTNQKDILRKRIRRRMEQCQFSMTLIKNSIDDIQKELNNYLEELTNSNRYREELEANKKQIDVSIRQLDELEKKLKNDKYKSFEEKTYAEVFEYKQKFLEIKSEIELLELELKKLREGREYSDDNTTLEVVNNRLIDAEVQASHDLAESAEMIRNEEKKIRSLRMKKRKIRQKIVYLEAFRDQKEKIEFIKETIRETGLLVKDKLYPQVNKRMNKTLFEITQRYNEIFIDDNGNIQLHDINGGTKELRHVSLGTLDQIYFILGIIMIESAEEGEKLLPIILDDAFVQYDDERFENVMDVLTKLNRQIVIFSCYEREYEYLKKKNVQFNYETLMDESEKQMEDIYVESTVY